MSRPALTLLFPMAAVVLTCAAASPSLAQVVLNEVVSSNRAGILDEDGDPQDWIEIHNSGAAPISLEGLGLSDDPTKPHKWRLPPIEIAPFGHLLVFASGKDRAPWARHWHTVIDQGHPLTYRVGTTAPSPDWAAPEFDDGDWVSGTSGVGYGDGDDATEVAPTLSIYVRLDFTVRDPREVSAALMHVDYDDGFVAYLNGTEILRANIGTPGFPPAHDETSGPDHEALLYRGRPPESFPVPRAVSLLRRGDNVLAVQVHNVSATSSDLTLIPFLTLGLVQQPPGGAATPAFFTPPALELHTNFKVDSAGETVVLADAGGLVIDQVETGRLHFGASMGRTPDGGPVWRIHGSPTPGAPNDGATFEGYSEAPRFSRPAGFYPEGAVVSVSSFSAAATIRYTLDGSDPTPESPGFTGPISISATTVLRARAFETGRLPGPVATATFLVDEPSDLPVVSLVSDPANLFDDDIGIYVLGREHDTEFPYRGANFWQDWERPVHMELFEPDGSLAVALDAGVKIHGGWSRGYAQKSLRIAPRGGYGEGAIAHRLFEEKAIDRFGAILLRNSGNDWSVTHYRDALMQRATIGYDLEYQAYRPAAVFLNGAYWGIHNIRERLDEEYLAANHGVDPDGVDILEGRGTVFRGRADHYVELIAFLGANSLAHPANYAYVQTRMDTRNFATYCLFQIYFGNTDWPGKNIKFWRPQTPGGRWRWMLFDLDFGAGLFSPYGHDTLAFATAEDGPGWPNPPWSTLLLRALLENDEFKTDFINRYADLINGPLSPSALHDLHAEIRAGLDREIGRHMLRWGVSREDWLAAGERVTSFITQRPAHARGHIRDHFDVGDEYTLSLDVSPAGGGSIRLTAIEVDRAWAGSYFQGNPVALTAVPAVGHRFVGWSDASLPRDAQVVIEPGTDYAVSAIFARSPAAAVMISEINYNSAPSFDPGDWVELHNAGDGSIDVSGWVFSDGGDNHAFMLPHGTVLPARGHLVLCRDAAVFAAAFPDVTNHVGDMDFGFRSSGELLRLFDDEANPVDAVPYGSVAPWPTEPDGGGPTLELIDPSRDNELAASWATSKGHGTPGRGPDPRRCTTAKRSTHRRRCTGPGGPPGQ